jgi:hypothetical protein
MADTTTGPVYATNSLYMVPSFGLLAYFLLEQKHLEKKYVD